MMENLINDLMDLGKLQKGVFRLENDFFSLPQVIQQAFQIVKATADIKKIEMHAIIKDQNKLQYFHKLEGDQRRYLQILLNFLSNALKFTPEGGKIIVKIEAEEIVDVFKKRVNKAKSGLIPSPDVFRLSNVN